VEAVLMTKLLKLKTSSKMQHNMDFVMNYNLNNFQMQ